MCQTGRPPIHIQGARGDLPKPRSPAICVLSYWRAPRSRRRKRSTGERPSVPKQGDTGRQGCYRSSCPLD
ncbi:hypothetical protein CPAR01_06718 [Colletotrichum paranaense]|uniref:Uncharacterized protein n=1 Tax=Colletotrichum paranaense TaxID=1914294 RepID=A0ABQ9SNB3_9PEZI|nr:uncharacterized protein CPAR01_06718 [Colletotrichum paranaense]KAK1540729.1 hypothetical protein CPAR01_06718 [Colletotrichum paranaense]